MSQVFSEERIRQMRSLLPKRKSGEKPETLSDKEQARTRLMELADRRAREGSQFQQTPGELFGAQADSVLHGIPLASEVRAEEQKARRQARQDKQRRLREVRKEIRDITVLLNKRTIDDDGNVVFGVPMDPEDKIEFENQRAALKKERDELEGKKLQKRGEIATGDGTRGRPYEIQDSQEQFDSVPSGAWFRLPGDPPGKAREKP